MAQLKNDLLKSSDRLKLEVNKEHTSLFNFLDKKFSHFFLAENGL